MATGSFSGQVSGPQRAPGPGAEQVRLRQLHPERAGHLLVDAGHGLRGRADVPRRGASGRGCTGKRKLETARWFQWTAIVSIAFPYIAAIAGWVLTEMGRQPWIVQGLLQDGRRRTRRASARPGSRSASRSSSRLYLDPRDRRLRAHAALRAARPAAAARGAARAGGDVLMDLQILWFVLIVVLWSGYFLLEGFDFGVGMLLPFVPRNEAERGAMFESIGPVWDGNEVWLVVAAGATFAAFPAWYATMFSGFYLALLLLLFFLIIRVVSFEWREKSESPAWRRVWLGANALGSTGIALVWGIGLANLIHGVPIDSNGDYDGNLVDLFTPLHGVRRDRVRARLRVPRRDLPRAQDRGRPHERVGAAAQETRPARGRSSAPTFLIWTVVVAVDRNDKDVFPVVVPAVLGIAALAARGAPRLRGQERPRVHDDRARDRRGRWRRSSPASTRGSWSRAPNFATASTSPGAASAHYTLAVMTRRRADRAADRPRSTRAGRTTSSARGSAARRSIRPRRSRARPAARRPADHARPRPAPRAPSPPGAPPARAGRGPRCPVRGARPRPGGPDRESRGAGVLGRVVEPMSRSTSSCSRSRSPGGAS